LSSGFISAFHPAESRYTLTSKHRLQNMHNIEHATYKPVKVHLG
jgi:hypothetical protein